MDLPASDAPCGLLIFDDSGSIVSGNPALHRMLGYEPGEFSLKRMAAILSTAGRVFYQTHFFPTLKLEGKVEEVYLTFRGREDQDIPFLVNAVRIRQGEMTVNYAALFRISKRGRFEEDLIAAKKEAERANQAKDDFLAALSHELRTPLTPVLLSAMMIESEPELPEGIREQVVSIRRNVELEARLIDDLLDVTRISHGKLRLDQAQADVHELLGHALELVEHSSNAKLI
ncbi:MAG: PAS domain-containing protein, partial [Verrucomicrobiaceae bacterium]